MASKISYLIGGVYRFSPVKLAGNFKHPASSCKLFSSFQDTSSAVGSQGDVIAGIAIRGDRLKDI
jgi:hypothetical protein